MKRYFPLFLTTLLLGSLLCSLPLVFGQAASAPISLVVPYVQYLQLGLTPADQGNTSELIIQNKEQTIDLNYADGTSVTLAVLDFRGDFDVAAAVMNPGEAAAVVKTFPLTVTVKKGMTITIKLTPFTRGGNRGAVADAGVDQTIYLSEAVATLDGWKSVGSTGSGTIAPLTSYAWAQSDGPQGAAIKDAKAVKTEVRMVKPGDYQFSLTVANGGSKDTDYMRVTVKDPEKFDFKLASPANGAMVTDTRKPTLTWAACAGATKYDIYLNITRTDYDWHASGNLLDRYTVVGESTTNSFTVKDDLVDRWTYKWYVQATTPDGAKTSNTQQFGLYLPYITKENDGVPIINGCRDMNKDGTIEPYEDWHLTPEARAADLVSRMSTEEKCQQFFYGADQTPGDGFAFSYGVEGGMRTVQYDNAKAKWGIPCCFAGDKIHGWKTIYPTELGMAAMHDMNMVNLCGDLQRREEKAFGFTGTLCPLAEVDTKALYPRFQEGTGENAEESAAELRALVCGMQGGPEVNPHSIMVTIKHWPSQGAGGESALQYDAVTIKYHMKPWQAIVDANAASVMPGYNNCPFLDGGVGANSSRRLNRYLRNDLNFKGFVVTDWLAASTGGSTDAMSAGIDVLGGAPSEFTDLTQLAANIGMDRVNESCLRILEMKIRLGLFENPYGDPTCKWTNATDHDIALAACKKSITLLKNDGVLPLKLNAGDEVVVGGPRATWANHDADPNVIWQSCYYDDPQQQNYVEAITTRGARDQVKVSQDTSPNPKVAVVVIGEQSYTHGTEWANKDPNIPADQQAVVKKWHDAGVKVILVVITPRPYVLTPLVDMSDAIVIVYRGGSAIEQATAGLIFGDFQPTGTLPFQLPKSLAQLGSDNPNDQVEKWDLPYDIGATDAERAQIRAYIAQDKPVPPTFGDPLFQYGSGLQGFDGKGAVSPPYVPNPNVQEVDLPDLILTSVGFNSPAQPKAGDQVTFKAVAKNQGKAATKDGITIGMRFLVDGPTPVIWSDNDNTSLAPGQSVTLVATGGTAGATWTATPGTHTVTAIVDDADRISESDNNNNTLTWTFTIP